ncbi:hypothetical protein MNBD_IGNAVI01-1837 [hydrothermal vent metagenome]|uniref:Glycosyl hydrolase 36 catalytic domain-containing protein n=1 Tax=hydrothermal vent metagenome TaxID=652676 RepID=A0A3B1C4C4_9ZZZZ
MNKDHSANSLITSIFILLLFSSTGLFGQSNSTKENDAEKKGFNTLWEKATYANINSKSWDQILAENTFKFRPPYTVHLPIQPVHSPDFIHVDAALNVTRRRVTENVSMLDKESYPAAREQESFAVQFAFDDPPFIPDFKQSALSLEENKYPVVTADYFAWDIDYQIEYSCTAIDEEQSLLWIKIIVRNEDEKIRSVDVRTKINFYREDKLFSYHYFPFNFDASRWLPPNKIQLDGNSIIKESKVIGKVVPGDMDVEWERKKHYEDKEFNKKWGGHNPYYVLPSMMLKDVKNVIHAQAELKPGEERTFSIALLTNDSMVTSKHLEILEEASAEENKKKALAHFKNQFTKENTELHFPLDNWQDVFTAIQTSALQLMVKYPDKTNLMPTQGGSSERFFVWVWEAVHMLRPMLRVGYFEPVRKSLDYIFSLQDAGCPPEGKVTTTKGSIGTTGPKWMCTTGAALALASDYYLYSNEDEFLDQYLPKILKASQWIVGEIKATRKLNPDGTRPLYYGLMPFGWATDGDIGYVVSMTDGYSFWGLEKTVNLLERIGHKDAHEYRKELEMYRADIAVAVKGLAQPDGFIERKILTDEKGMITKKFANVVSSAMLGYTGAVESDSEIFRNFIKYYEENRAVGYFMGNMDREIAYIGTAEYIWQQIYLSLGEWKKAFATTQVNFKYGMTHDTYQVQERFSRRNPAFTPWQPNGSGNGRMLDMMLNSLYFESDEGVTLLAAVPFSWLQANKTIELKNLYTKTGRVSLEINAIDAKTCEVILSSLDGNSLPSLIRLPEDLNAVTENPSIENEGKGIFKLADHIEKIVFKVSD